MTTITGVSQSLNPTSLVSLYTVDARNIGYSLMQFCAEREADGSIVSFQGRQFPYLAVKAEGFEWSSDGTMPRPKLTVSSLNPVLFSLIVETSGLMGAMVIRERTLEQFLDGHKDATLGLKYATDIFMVSRIMSMDKEKITFELCCPLDLPRCELPARKALRTVCPWHYRRWNSATGQFVYATTTRACPYTGTKYFNKNGEVVTSASLDVCGRRLSDCVKRFGRNNLPYGGFPGIARNRAS